MTTKIILAAATITLLVLGYFYWELTILQQQAPNVLPLPENAVVLMHSFKDGTHRYAGEITLEHSCYSVTAEMLTDPIDPSNLAISIKTVDNLLNERLCVHIPTRYPFTVTVNAPLKVVVALRINGVETPTAFVETKWQDAPTTKDTTSNP